MRKTFFTLPLIGAVLASLVCMPAALAQDFRFERKFASPQADVERALQEIQDSVKGRLPILEGFVDDTSQPLDHFERGYYECALKITSDPEGGTLVRITAKVTAWYAGPNAEQSGYRALPSNGRIEADLLDRLEELLAKKLPVVSSSVSSGVPAVGLTGMPRSAASRPRPPLRAALPDAPLRPAGSAATAAAAEDPKKLRKRREDAEKKLKSLNDDVRNFEEILRNQSHPDNLAVVRKAGTPILAKQGGAALLNADAQDEFEILGLEGNWVHVQISGVSRGWVQRALVDLPEGFAASAKKDAAADPIFHVTREETHSYSGASQELRGKAVRIVWLAPVSAINQASTPQAKKNFAQDTFARVYKEQSATRQPPAGVVIVFDSADGGQVSIALSDLGQWAAGALTDDSFWKQCSVDPPDLFQEVHKP
jgi:hypothetical protein